jgi:hypothetical protein
LNPGIIEAGYNVARASVVAGIGDPGNKPRTDNY